MKKDSLETSRKARVALWKDVCNEYLKEFCTKHEYKYEPDMWVASNPGTVAEVCDMFVGMEDIRYDIDNNIPEPKFSEWYWKNLEVYELTGCHYMNYSSFCMGAPDKWTEEELQKVRAAKERVEQAKKELFDEIERIKHKDNKVDNKGIDVEYEF